MSGTVTVDLVGHLNLPTGRLYWVFLWLDDYVSPLLAVDTQLIDPETDEGIFSGWTRTKTLPDEGDEPEVTLELVRGEGGLGVAGSVYAPAPRVPGAPTPVTVLGLCDRTRLIGGVVEPLPAHLQGATEWSFQVPLARLLPEGAGPRSPRVVALAAGALSPVLAAPPA